MVTLSITGLISVLSVLKFTCHLIYFFLADWISFIAEILIPVSQFIPSSEANVLYDTVSLFKIWVAINLPQAIGTVSS